VVTERANRVLVTGDPLTHVSPVSNVCHHIRYIEGTPFPRLTLTRICGTVKGGNRL